MTTIDPTERPTPAPQVADGESRRAAGHGTGTRATRVLGIATIIAMAWLVAFGLGFSPADVDQEEAVRILYVHVPTIWVAYVAFTITAISSGIYLWSRRAKARRRPASARRNALDWDRLAGASAEIGVAFVAVTLAVGAMWGRRCCSSPTSATSPSVALVVVTSSGPSAARSSG